MAIVDWDAERSEPEYRQGQRSEGWEVVVPELLLEMEPRWRPDVRADTPSISNRIQRYRRGNER